MRFQEKRQVTDDERSPFARYLKRVALFRAAVCREPNREFRMRSEPFAGVFLPSLGRFFSLDLMQERWHSEADGALIIAGQPLDCGRTWAGTDITYRTPHTTRLLIASRPPYSS